MPLTFAHPAAVLPLFRGPLVPTALIVGSMSPDIPYFLRATGVTVSAQSWYEPFFNATRTHTPGGGLTVALAMALALYLCLKAAARPVMTLLPDSTGSPREDRASAPVAVSSGWVLVSLVLGIATHLVWDSFTHADGWIVENASALREPLIGSLSTARALQHVSTALGLLVITYVVWRRRTHLIPERGAPARARLAWSLIGAAAAGLAGAATMTALRWDRETTAEHVLSSAAVGVGLGVGVAAALAVAAWWLIHLARNGARSPRG